MPRELILSNGRMLVTFDSAYSLSDIYFPYIGTENHANRRHSRLGLWVEGDFAWLDETDWKLSLRYAGDTLVTQIQAESERLGIALTAEDAIDFDKDVLLRKFTVRNTTGRPLDVRLYVHLDVAIGGNTVGDTVFYHPETQTLVAYKNRHYLLLGGSTGTSTSWTGWTMGRKESWRDAEDGLLMGVPLAFGSIDCVGELRLDNVQPGESATAHTWLATGQSLEDVVALHEFTQERTPDRLIDRTRNYWQAWVAKDADLHPGMLELPEDIQVLYRRSLLIARADLDHGGAIIASPDSEITGVYSTRGVSGSPIEDVFEGQEHYAYTWPRDSSFVAMAFDNAGYAAEARAYLAFCAETMVQRQQDGEVQAYMLQKYLCNGSVASNVIPWIDDDGKPRLPIQEDESALVLIALRNHYDRTRDWGFVSDLYRRMITGLANFLTDFRDPATGLPSPSQDLWEERQGVHAFTVATVWRALHDAAYFAGLFAESDLAARYVAAADEVKAGTERLLYDSDAGRFARSLWYGDGVMTRDTIPDMSVFALSYFGMFDPDDPRMVATMAAAESTLMIAGEHGGAARFDGDTYQLRLGAVEMKVPGNPWPLCTLWLAQYRLQRAKTMSDLEEPLRLLRLVEQSALAGGVLSEQIDPASGEPAGATPLTWAHATLVQTVLDYLKTSSRLAAKSR